MGLLDPQPRKTFQEFLNDLYSYRATKWKEEYRERRSEYDSSLKRKSRKEQRTAPSIAGRRKDEPVLEILDDGI